MISTFELTTIVPLSIPINYRYATAFFPTTLKDQFCFSFAEIANFGLFEKFKIALNNAKLGFQASALVSLSREIPKVLV